MCRWRGKKQKIKKFSALPSVALDKEAFAECRDHGTQRLLGVENPVPNFGEYQEYDTRQRVF